MVRDGFPYKGLLWPNILCVSSDTVDSYEYYTCSLCARQLFSSSDFERLCQYCNIHRLIDWLTMPLSLNDAGRWLLMLIDSRWFWLTWITADCCSLMLDHIVAIWSNYCSPVAWAGWKYNKALNHSYESSCQESNFIHYQTLSWNIKIVFCRNSP